VPVVDRDLNPRARALVTALRKIRKQHGISSRELSKRLGHSHALVSHWETGRRIPDPDRVAALLVELHVTGEEHARIMRLAEAAAEPGWLGAGLAVLPAHLVRAIDCERAADAIVEWSPATIPELARIPEYARAQLTLVGASYAATESRVLIDGGRREVVNRAIDPLPYTVLIGEAALGEPIGPPRVMAEQLNDLAATAQRANTTLQILPARIGWHPGLAGAFTIYHFPESSEMLYFPHHATGIFVSDQADIAHHHRALETLRRKALSEADSIRRIAETARRWAAIR
jgi:transcriptional regulator with XRE-family HTH domain